MFWYILSELYLFALFFFLGIRIAFIFRGAGTGFIFLSTGKSLRPSLNSIAGSIMLSSYSCTISLTLFRGFGIGLSVVENDLSSTDIMSLCFSICLMLGLGIDSAFCFNNNSLINFDLLSFFEISPINIYILIMHIIHFHYTIPIDKSFRIVRLKSWNNQFADNSKLKRCLITNVALVHLAFYHASICQPMNNYDRFYKHHNTTPC